MEDREANQLKAALVGQMVESTPPPPEGVIPKLAEAIVSVFTPEEYRELEQDCKETGKAISLAIAERLLALPRTERKRISKEYNIPWTYLSRK